jgi:hypothetical protein
MQKSFQVIWTLVVTVLLTLLVLGCATVPHGGERAGYLTQKVIGRDVVMRLTELGGYARLNDDPSGPFYYFISDLRMICLVDSDTFIRVRVNERFACQWRNER